MSVEIAWKQNIFVTDSYLLELLLIVFTDLVRRHSSVNSADKTFAVQHPLRWLTNSVGTICDHH